MSNSKPVVETSPARRWAKNKKQAISGVFEVLSSQRRRLALHYLATQVGAVEVSELADQVAVLEGNHTQSHYERICTSLIHVHVPKLVDTGILVYDPGEETVTLCDGAGELTPYLDLAAKDDIC